jgi:hypothetical protein
MSIYQNIIFGKIDNYALQNPKHFKDIKNIIIALLIDLLNKYKKHKNPQKFYVIRGKKILKRQGCRINHNNRYYNYSSISINTNV